MNMAVKQRASGRTLQEIISRNVKILYARDWKQNEPQGKTIYNIARGGNATRVTLELIANRSKIPVWYLFLPLDEMLLTSSDLEEIVSHFISADPEARKGILQTTRLITR